MISKECRLTRRTIDELELGEQLGDRAEAHLSICAACREFRAERAELRDLVGSLERVAAPADFDMRLRARMAEQSSTPRQPFFAHLFSTPALAAAALFVVVTGSVVWVAQRNDDASGPVATNQQAQPAATVAANSGDKANVAAAADATDEKSADDQTVMVAENRPSRRTRPVSRGPRSQDFSVLPANSIREGAGDQAFVNAPSKPVVFALEDERGTKRKISLPPVSFGAQRLVDNRVPVSYAGNSRIW